MEKKGKVAGIVISILAIGIILAMVIMQIFMKTDVIKQISQSQEEKSIPKALDVSSWDPNRVTVYTDKSGKKAPIPVGYVASEVVGETEIDTGLVIYEGTEPVTGDEIGVPGTAAWTASCTRNQWVWVPVPDVDRIYDKSTRKSKLYTITQTGRDTYTSSNYSYHIEPGIASSQDNEENFSQCNMQGMTQKKLLYELETELDETIKSIEKYGGFYIGRYETGETKTEKPVVKRMNKNSITSWYRTYACLKTLGANYNVKSNIIWGCLWDETLQWFKESGAKTDEEIYNSATWGNYKDSEGFTYYTTVSGATASKIQNMGTVQVPTGASERNKANNIYDMAGNEEEWTLEAVPTSSRGLLGGNGNSSSSEFSSVGFRRSSIAYNGHASRAYFYIK